MMDRVVDRPNIQPLEEVWVEKFHTKHYDSMIDCICDNFEYNNYQE